jgi:malate dehydrogenase (oxaloacetate-decarboxylating)
MQLQPSASYSITLRIETAGVPGTLGRVTSAIGETGGVVGAIDIVSVGGGRNVRDLVVSACDHAHAQLIVERVSALSGVSLLQVSDRTFLMHVGGKIEISGRVSVKTSDDLSMVYTPGVARVCLAIRDDPAKQWGLTIKSHTIAVVSDGTAVLGLGDIGPAGAQPVMEGKCLIFKSFAGIDAFPICLDTTNADEIVETIKRIAPVFGGINLEDIAAPKCFEIEERLRQELDIPVMHDDQHGTAIVILAALKNALKVVGKSMPAIKIVIAGAGAAGTATARMLADAGAGRIVLCDRAGAIYAGRSNNMNPYKDKLAAATNPLRERGGLRDVLRGADVFIGLSGPDVLTAQDVAAMGIGPIVFAMANPIPEIQPESLVGIARVVATGRSDYPNQINNSLSFPGVFRGALDVRATDINAEMKLAAAEAIAALVADDDLHEDYIIPSMFDPRVVGSVAHAVAEAALRTGVARGGPELGGGGFDIRGPDRTMPANMSHGPGVATLGKVEPELVLAGAED